MPPVEPADRQPGVVVVTGAAQGMGRACVDRLRPTAEHLVAVDLEAPELEGAVGVACDVSKADAVAALADQVRDLGPLRALVHAAGISPTMADPRRIFEVDLLGTQLVLDAFEPMVVPGASAVCFASAAAHQVALMGPNPVLDGLVDQPVTAELIDQLAAHLEESGVAYAWAKRGVIRVVAHASVRWGPLGGRVNSVSPGIIDTGMGQQELAAQPMMELMIDRTPVGRMGRADEIAAIVAFLLSDAASFVSGADLLADGAGLEGLRAAIASIAAG